MAEPEDHILPQLQEFREEFRAFRNQFMESMDEVSDNLVRAKERLASITKGLECSPEPPDHLAKAMAEAMIVRRRERG
jgi:hypothetical protein